MGQVVLVLYAEDVTDRAALADLGGCDITQPDVSYQALLLELCQDRQRLLQRPFGRAMCVEHAAQVDHVEHLQAKISKILVHRLDQFFA